MSHKSQFLWHTSHADEWQVLNLYHYKYYFVDVSIKFDMFGSKFKHGIFFFYSIWDKIKLQIKAFGFSRSIPSHMSHDFDTLTVENYKLKALFYA